MQRDRDLNSIENQETISSLINARIGLFASDNIVLGFGVGFSKIEESGKSIVGVGETVSYNLDIPMTNYFLYAALQSQVTDRLKSNFSLDVRFGRGEYTENSRFSGVNSSFTNKFEGDIEENEVILRPGILYFLGKSFLLNISYGELGVSNSTLKLGNNRLEDNVIIASFNPSTLRFGLAFYFAKKKE
jgi:hypothetical protein